MLAPGPSRAAGTYKLVVEGEPAGRRAGSNRYLDGGPNGIRTRVLALRGLRPRPLDDGAFRGRRPKTTRGETDRKGAGRGSAPLRDLFQVPGLVRAALLGVHAVIRLGELLVHTLAGIAHRQAHRDSDRRV